MPVPFIEEPTAGVLIVGSEDLSDRIADLPGDRGYSVQTAPADQLVQELETHGYDVLVLDLGETRQQEDPLVEQALEVQSWLSVVVIKDGSAEAGLEPVKKGVYFYLTHPVPSKSLEWVLKIGVERSRLLSEIAALRKKALSDDLTEAYNRRYLDITLDEELERASRYGRALSILFVDLNHLKDINDRYGHLSGSKVIQRVAGVFQEQLRRCDKIFRFGGDEFVVTLPETDAEQASSVVRRLGDALNRDEIPLPEGTDVTVTAAFGIATYPFDGTNKEELIHHADGAMYRCKAKMHKAVAGGETTFGSAP